MTRRFHAFVIFAEMRTGSNHLEESLNGLDDIQCHGELFNPTFIGHHNRFEYLGFDLNRRERDPVGLVDAMIAQGGPLPGFRFFHDHDPRVLDRVLADARIAKVLLTRNPLDSYVSRKIATATGQWRLTDLKHAKTDKITFDEAEFVRMLADWSGFRDTLRRGLQTSGQTLFPIRYEDINDIDVLNGLAGFLGSAHSLPEASQRLKRQNPGAVEDKVANARDMVASLARIDRFGLDRVLDGEVPRAPGVSGFVAHPETGLLLLPVAGGPTRVLLDWMAGIGDVGRDALLTGMTQKDLRKWMRAHPGFVSFSVVRHPLHRLLRAYHGVQQGQSARSEEIRSVLSTRYNVPLAEGGCPSVPDLMAFAAFLKGHLQGQTSLRAMADWATQAALLQAAAHVVLPQRIIREGDAGVELAGLAESVGVEAPEYPGDPTHDALSQQVIGDSDLQKAVFDTYRKDYVQFGFAQTPSVSG
jgi:hypothetical protein